MCAMLANCWVLTSVEILLWRPLVNNEWRSLLCRLKLGSSLKSSIRIHIENNCVSFLFSFIILLFVVLLLCVVNLLDRNDQTKVDMFLFLLHPLLYLELFYFFPCLIYVHRWWKYVDAFNMLLSSTVFPLPLGAKRIPRSGSLGTTLCFDCLQLYSITFMSLIIILCDILLYIRNIKVSNSFSKVRYIWLR